MKAEELIKYLPEESKEKNRMRIKKEALSTHLKTEYLETHYEIRKNAEITARQH